MLIGADPFRDLGRLTRQVPGTTALPAAVPTDACRQGVSIHARFGLPGIKPESIGLTVEQNVLTVRVGRAPVTAGVAAMAVSERPWGAFPGGGKITVGVLILAIPADEAARARAVRVTSSGPRQAATA